MYLKVKSFIGSVHCKGIWSPHGNLQWALRSRFCPLRDCVDRRGRGCSLPDLKFSRGFPKAQFATKSNEPWRWNCRWTPNSDDHCLDMGLWPCLHGPSTSRVPHSPELCFMEPWPLSCIARYPQASSLA